MFYSLSTGRMLDRTDWTELTMPDNIIKKVERMARVPRYGYMFTDRNNQVIDDDNGYDPDYKDNASETSNEEGSITGVEDGNEDNDRHLVNDIKESNQDQHSNEEDNGELKNLSDVQNLREPVEDYVAV